MVNSLLYSMLVDPVGEENVVPKEKVSGLVEEPVTSKTKVSPEEAAALGPPWSIWIVIWLDVSGLRI